MTVVQAEVIVALAANGLCQSRAARQIYRHPNTVGFHAKAVMRETGKNPFDFYDMCELLPIAKKILSEKEAE